MIVNVVALGGKTSTYKKLAERSQRYLSTKRHRHIQFFDYVIIKLTSSYDVSPYAESLSQTTIKAGDPLQSDRVMANADLAK